MNSRRLKVTATLTAAAFALCLAFTSQVPAAEAATTNPPPFAFAMHLLASLQQQVKVLSTTVAGFADAFTTNQLTFTRATGQELCLQQSNGSPVCVTGDQLAALLAGEEASTIQTDAAVPTAATANATTTIDKSPIIQINGDNPAIVQVGDSYQDLGATITGPTADLNLGITTYLNGTLTSNIVIDTSQAATDTIDYVATDQTGLTSTSTRTVIIEAPASASANDIASTTSPQSAQGSTSAQ